MSTKDHWQQKGRREKGQPDGEAVLPTQHGERLQKVLAHAGVASRRHAEELITQGRVQVNGQVINTLGVTVDPERDEITCDGKPVQVKPPLVYILLHKPIGYVSTVSDPQGRPTVLELAPKKGRLYPVGRLDQDSEGLLLLTNDGDLTLRLTHPRYVQAKEYHALVQGYPDWEAIEMLKGRIVLDGQRTAPARVQLLDSDGEQSWLSLTIHEGRNRQVRRMLEHTGYPVLRLIRVRVGPLYLGNLPSGAYRYLTDEEVAELWAN